MDPFTEGDRMNNHLPISKEMEAVMQKHLSEKYSEEEADERWKKSSLNTSPF